MNKEKEFSLNSKEKKFCVNLAKKSIEYSLTNENFLKLNEIELKNVPKKLFEKRTCFVTLKINNNLRGCIGNLNPYDELYLGIIRNAYSAAFTDPRFPSLKENELNELEIEISILTTPKKLIFKNKEDLLKKITKKNGLILSKNSHSATFLPSVWEDIPTKEDFLSNLCRKAGLDEDEWTKPGLNIQIYHSISAK